MTNKVISDTFKSLCHADHIKTKVYDNSDTHSVTELDFALRHACVIWFYSSSGKCIQHVELFLSCTCIDLLHSIFRFNRISRNRCMSSKINQILFLNLVI